MNGVAVAGGSRSGRRWDDEEARRDRWSRRLRPREEAAAEFRRVEAVVQRGCVAADLPMPEVVVESDKAPLSWTTALPARAPKLHLTSGLLERATDEQLAIVVAHELTHIARRDAWVMTLVGGPDRTGPDLGDASAAGGAPRAARAHGGRAPPSAAVRRRRLTPDLSRI